MVNEGGRAGGTPDSPPTQGPDGSTQGRGRFHYCITGVEQKQIITRKSRNPCMEHAFVGYLFGLLLRITEIEFIAKNIFILKFIGYS